MYLLHGNHFYRDTSWKFLFIFFKGKWLPIIPNDSTSLQYVVVINIGSFCLCDVCFFVWMFTWYLFNHFFLASTFRDSASGTFNWFFMFLQNRLDWFCDCLLLDLFFPACLSVLFEMIATFRSSLLRSNPAVFVWLGICQMMITITYYYNATM